MIETDTSGWTPLPGTANCDCYEIGPHLVVMVPHDGMTDTGDTARENLAWQRAHWQRVGRSGCVAVFMDHIAEQEAGARDVYGTTAPDEGTLGYALIGGTFWGRAIASVFMGLKKPRTPTRFFASLEDALPWIEERNRAGTSGR